MNGPLKRAPPRGKTARQPSGGLLLRQIERPQEEDVEIASASYEVVLEQLRAGALMLTGLVTTYDKIGAHDLSRRDRTELDEAVRLIGEAIDRISDPG